MSQDTPYLLRMDMIKVAQQRASEEFHMKYSIAAENANKTGSQMAVIPYPTTEQIVVEAAKIKAFVDGK
jgi:hypothetical protein